MRVGIVIFLLALTACNPKASAQDADGRWVRQAVRASCDFWENCPRYQYRWRYVRHYELRAKVYGYYRDDRNDQQCRDFVTAVGEERYGRERAKEAAEQAWMELVRNKCGVRFMDLRNSRQGTWECGRSSTGNRASERAQDMVGKYLEQCTLRAIPRRAELEPVGKD